MNIGSVVQVIGPVIDVEFKEQELPPIFTAIRVTSEGFDVPDPIDIIKDLGSRGSLFLTRPAIMHYMAERNDLVTAAETLFSAIKSGVLQSNINYEYQLKDAVSAHTAIESGSTLGSTILLP